MTPETFRHAMRHVPTAVSVVTSIKDDEPRGITISAFASVSADPPMVLICVNREARSYLYIATSRSFCLNILAHDQRDLAERFSGRVRERQFEDIGFDVGATGAPVIRGAIAHFDCIVEEEHHAGSHSIFIGRVMACASHDGMPLGYFNGGFHNFNVSVE